MHFLVNWINHIWNLLQVIGWWSILGLAIGSFLGVLLKNMLWKRHGSKTLFFWAFGGAILPMCNFGVIPIAMMFLKTGLGIECVLTFLSAATLLNPAGVLLSYAYMGPKLTVIYTAAAFGTALFTGLTAHRILSKGTRENDGKKYNPVDCTPQNSIAFMAEIALRLFIGILLEALLLTFGSEIIKPEMMMYPEGLSFTEISMLGLFRHVCIPDDITMAGSLTASGMMPGGVCLFLLLGIGSNLPELTVLYGITGKRTALLYFTSLMFAAVLTFIMVQLFVAPGFVPQFSLEHAETWTLWANRLSIRTWMPARIPCSILLLILCGYGVRKKN